MKLFKPACKCGWNGPECETRKRAEVLADIHEAAFYRRPYQHDAYVVVDTARVGFAS